MEKIVYIGGHELDLLKAIQKQLDEGWSVKFVTAETVASGSSPIINGGFLFVLEKNEITLLKI